MSDSPEKHEKIHDPTPQRIKKAREDGNLFKSKEFVSAGVLFLGGLMLYYGVPRVFRSMQRMMQETLLNAPETQITVQSAPGLFMRAALHVSDILLPFFVLMLVLGFSLNVVQTGWNITLKPLQPKASRINPQQGLQRIFSSKGLFEAFKAVMKIVIVAPIAFFNIRHILPEVLQLHLQGLPQALATAAGWIVAMLAQMIIALVLLAIIDFSFEKWKYHEDLKMTDKELKDERKQQEGDPQLRGKRKQMAREMAQRPRFDHAVMKADVVVTNPTHYAVALAYDRTADAAPHVVIKGIRKRALRIKQFALDHDVPVVEDRPLARALYSGVPEGHAIPEELYTAVATILAEVYRDRGERV